MAQCRYWENCLEKINNVRFFWWESAKRKMDRWQLRIDNYWKFRFHEKIKKKLQVWRYIINCQMTIVNYQSTRRTQGLYKLYGLYKLSTDLIERLSLITHLIIIIYLINSIENDGFVFKFLLQMWRIFRNIYSTNIRKNENIVLFDRFSVTILTKI